MTKIISFGDSNTVGNGTEGSPYPNRYTNVLTTLLQTDGHVVTLDNHGNSGVTSETCLNGINILTSEHYDVVTMMIGTNDVNIFYMEGNTPAQAAARHRVAINAIIAAFRTKFTPDLIVWIVPISPRWGGDWGGLTDWTDLMQPTYNAIVTEAIDFCGDNKYNKTTMVRGDLCIDNTDLTDYYDGLHLSITGAAKLAQYIRNYITLKINMD
jgi:lysophospholipase L1-like esterase